jgi:two-component system chemotaxis response regulator CheB
MQALNQGAFDFITKPEGMSAEQSREQIRKALEPRLKALASRLDIREILQRQSLKSKVSAPPVLAATSLSSVNNVSERMQRLSGNNKPEMVLIGVSTGGPAALGQLLPALPENLGVPILVVQHMPAMFTRSLAESLDSRCTLKIQEAVDGIVVLKNNVYIAPGGKQMKLVSGSNGEKLIKITDDPPENNCKPAVDYLFRSVANTFSGQAMAVILTGMGSDGTKGLRLLKRHKCFTIAQDEDSCVVYGMPKSAVAADAVDVSLPLDQIAGRIIATLRGGGL